MRLLLDTHIFLWYISVDPRLPASYQAAIREPSNDVYPSAVSIWEAVVKHDLGKLSLPDPPADYLPRQREAHGIAALPTGEEAMRHLARLPAIHRDPFDRMLVAQALQYGLTIVTVDSEVAAYPVARLPVN